MPYYQPSSTPPTAGVYSNRYISHRNQINEEDQEYEFGEPAPRQRQIRRGSNDEEQNNNGENELLQDPLSRRMLSLLTPLIPASSSTGIELHRITGPLSFIANNSSVISSQQSSFPHPSFQFRFNYDESDNGNGNGNGNGKEGLEYDSMGYHHHAHFFSPRKIMADEPFEHAENSSSQFLNDEYNSTHSQSDQRFKHTENQNENYVIGRYQHNPREALNGLQQNQSSYGDEIDPFLNAFGSSSTQPISTHQSHGFGHTYDHPENLSNTNSKHKKKKQRRIVQNDANGALGTASASAAGAEQGWAQVGQIASYHSSLDAEQAVGHQEKGKRKDKEKAAKKKKKKKKERPNPDIRTTMENMETPDTSQQRDQANGNNNRAQLEDQNDADFQPKSSRSKKDNRSFQKDPSQRSASISTSTSASTQSSAATPRYDPIPLETIEIFAERYQINNAGASSEALRSFLQIVQSQKFVSWTMIFHDHICSTPFLPSTKKYCTPKGAPCTMWNCTCDNQIRAMQASAPLVGAMFVFPMNGQGSGENAGDTDCFLLPLGPVEDPEDGPMDIDAGFERMARWPFLKISCTASLQERWDTLRKILLDRSLIKVTFQAQVGLMPFHYHSAHDVVTLADGKSDNDITPNPSIGYLDLVLPNVWDLRLASWMLTPHAKEESLELASKKAGFSHICPKPRCQGPADPSPQLQGLIQAKEDLEFLYALYPIINRLLESNGLKDAFCEIESPVQSVLSSMECFGIGFKANRLVKIQQEIESRIERLNEEAKSITGDESFMISSPQQVSQLLFDRMGLRVPQTNSGQGPNKQNASQHKSTSEESLKMIQNELKSRDGQGVRIIDVVLEFRALNKVLSTYIRPYPKLARDDSNQIHARTAKRRSKKKTSETKCIQRIHPMWMQTAVRTGRLSCRKPNMQQVPTGSVIQGVYPRNFFTSSTKDSCLFACDYSQNEVRILAHMSNDEALIRLFTDPNATDIYKQMSSVTSGKAPTEVTDEERAVSKQVTLAIMYGMGLNTVAKKLGTSKAQARIFFNSFYGRFQGVKRWMDETIRFARANKYVTTITGRKR